MVEWYIFNLYQQKLLKKRESDLGSDEFLASI